MFEQFCEFTSSFVDGPLVFRMHEVSLTTYADISCQTPS